MQIPLLYNYLSYGADIYCTTFDLPLISSTKAVV